MQPLLIRSFRFSAVALLISTSACAWLPHWHRHKHAVREPATVPAVEAAPQDATTTDAAPAAAVSVIEASPDSATLPPSTPADAAIPGSTAGAIEFTEDFYLMHQRLHTSGLPDAGSMNAYNAFLCPQIVELVEAARARQKEFMTAHPGDKAPLADGDLFSSLAEGPEASKAGTVIAIAGGARVAVDMRRADGRKTTRWTDVAQIDRDADGIWCLADVEYAGSWPGANKGRLSETLKAAF